MADDIDIEEHDVLENPLIKRIFPDLSILKKEIIEYNNYDHEESSLSSNTEESNSATEAVTSVIEKGACSSGLINNNFKNKIILGSKHSTNKHKKQTLNVIKKAKICLPNITQYLNNNIKFCKVCLILFPSLETLNRHTLLAHRNIEKNCHVNENIETKKIQKPNYECLKCNTTFANVGNLNRHEKNIHSNSKNVKKKHDDKLMTKVNVMVNINESNVNLFPESNLKECFHCDLMFTTQQLLIDHLYEVLNTKKTQIAPNETCTDDKTNEQTKEVEKTYVQNKSIKDTSNKVLQSIKTDGIKDVDIDKIYACPICSYCFNIWDFYKAHMKKKHGINKVKQTSKVSYKPNCKFCDLQYSSYKYYNTHLHKRHKSKIFQKVRQSCNKVNQITNKVTGKVTFKIQKKQEMKQKVVLGSNTVNFGDNLKRQKNNKGHLNCIKNDVKIMALKTIVFKCIQCDIHFLTSESAKSHTNHDSLDNSNCIYCEKYFKEKDMNLHLQQHKYSNYLTVINISSEDNLTRQDKRQEIFKKILHKCEFCAVHFSKEHISDHYSVCETEPSQSTYCKICDVLIDENIKISHAEDHDINKLKPSDFKIIEFKKIKNKPIKRKQVSSTKMYFFNLSYCDVCNCNVTRAHYKSRIHIESRCSHFIKYVCKFCGLVFSNKSINTHRKLHQKFSNLSLKDFTFHDLKNGKKILPPIPVFPKCNSCEKHFITKFEVKRHVCFRNNHLTCPICQMKLSQTAYKLHIPFHNFSLNDDNMESEKSLISDDVNLDINLADLGDKLELREKAIAIFTCKNCDVSFNLYDQAIDHCHSHTDLDTTNPNTIECGICKLTYDVTCYEEHLQLHKDLTEGTFKYIKFDVFNFGSLNDKWLKHMFGSMPLAVVNDIIKNAIYKYETRVKMRILQNGSSDDTVYKCEKCQCFIDTNSIYDHSQSCNKNQKDLCSICHLPTYSADDVHEKCSSRIKSLRIVEFNRNEDVDVNHKIANMRKCYVLYECRLCHSVVDKNYESHLCAIGTSKECAICGLLLNELDYDTHISKHKRLTSFNGNFMKVILLGPKPNVNNSFQGFSDKLSKFCGIVCDYTFYKCLYCNVCIRNQRNTSQHYCLIDAAKSICPKCDLTFDEGKLKGHLKLHDTDPDFVKETIHLQTFDINKLVKKSKPHGSTEKKLSTTFDVKDQSNFNNNSEKSVKIYKCFCGLHYLSEAAIKVHTKKCNGKVKTKQCKQNCSKCDLTFSPDVLFKHLIEHHGNKDTLFQHEIINFNPKPSL